METVVRACGEEINSKTNDIMVRDLQMTNKDEIQKLKEGEEEKKKSYCAKCCINKKLSDIDIEKLSLVKNLTLKQKTPIRVLHRRPLAMRERIIHSISATRLSDFIFQLHLVTQAGTYPYADE
ncbi:putative tRNA pseudouridine synthase Pus10 [Centruroides sculpturatus]|uniref:putative tRNA pseudouridine synthase Pus10 n=1 Tax=Centruroides sculpturatus TaxID=218467 RepID=UPI000C6EA5CE|nr:putative tRNA pseudouridine synthase Pus10 [Centruroides sculpturatus]